LSRTDVCCKVLPAGCQSAVNFGRSITAAAQGSHLQMLAADDQFAVALREKPTGQQHHGVRRSSTGLGHLSPQQPPVVLLHLPLLGLAVLFLQAHLTMILLIAGCLAAAAAAAAAAVPQATPGCSTRRKAHSAPPNLWPAGTAAWPCCFPATGVECSGRNGQGRPPLLPHACMMQQTANNQCRYQLDI